MAFAVLALWGGVCSSRALLRPSSPLRNDSVTDLSALHISAALVGDAIKPYCSGHLRNSIRDTKQLVEIFLADLLRKASNGQHVFNGHSGVIFFAVWSDML